MNIPLPQRTRVKICGVTNPADAADAVELGADALGFNTYTGSKRYIDLKKEADWIRHLPPFVTKVAVMVKPTIAEAEAVFSLSFIDMVQFHGNEDEKFCAHFASLGLPFIKAIAVKDETSLHDVGRWGTPNILVDAYSPSSFGGTGQLIDTGLMEHFVRSQGGKAANLILSGGLKPANVKAAIGSLHPYAVDVASGVETAPGRKDKALMGEFILAVSGAQS